MTPELHPFRRWRRLALCGLTSLLALTAGCGGGGTTTPDGSGGGAGAGNAPLFSVGGSINGLASDGLVLRNGADTLAPAQGATRFTMPTALPSGTAFAIEIATQPTGLTCSVAKGSDTIDQANVRNAVVTCAPQASALGGRISGLATDGLVLANGTDTVSPPAGATDFTLPTAVAFGSSFDLTVQAQPTGQNCAVSQGQGQMGAAPVDSVRVACSSETHTVGGKVAGLVSQGLLLANGGDTLIVDAGAVSFTMPTAVAFGDAYGITVLAQPAGLTCSVAQGSGRMGLANINDVVVTCDADAFALGGRISGLSLDGLVLANGSDTLALAAGANSFTWPTAVSFSSPYEIRIQAQPTGLTCSVAHGRGTMGASAVDDVAITCDVNAFTVGGSISGLASGGLVLANGSDTIAVAANASRFTLPTPVAFGSTYEVTVLTQPLEKRCVVSHGSGTMGNAEVADVVVACAADSFTVSSFAGTGASGAADGAAGAASFGFPSGLDFDADGNLYVADATNHRIRRITPDGTVSTLAGSGHAGSDDGPGSTASFNLPRNLAVDAAGVVYVADRGNHKIRKIAPDGTVSTLAGTGAPGSDDGPGASASFNNPFGIAVDAHGNVYVGDTSNHKIRRIAPDGQVSTLAGTGAQGTLDGPGAQAQFNNPFNLVVDGDGQVYVGENSGLIRRVAVDGVVSTLAGSGGVGSADGDALSATFNQPRGMAVDERGTLYVGDTDNHLVRRISPDGQVSTLAGTGAAGADNGAAPRATFNHPEGLAIDRLGRLYVADTGNHLIRRITRD